jgi:hypothetical protein
MELGRRVSGSNERGPSRVLGWLLAAPALFAGAAGCYEYHDARVNDVQPNAMVHVVLSTQGSTSLAATIGPNATSIDGRVLSVDGHTLRLAATQIARVVGPEEFLRNESIDVPTSGALSISARSVSKTRTVLVIGGLVAGLIAGHALVDQPGVFTVKGGPSTGTK